MNKFFFYINIFFFFLIFFFAIIDLNLYFNPIDQLFYYIFITLIFYLIILFIIRKFIYIPFVIILLFLGYFKTFYNLNKSIEEKIRVSNILKTVTFNLNFYNDRFDSNFFFKDQKDLIDIYCFQEVSKDNYSKITTELSGYYSSHSDEEVNKWSSVIFSKHDLLNIKIYNNHTISHIKINDFNFALVCTHFNIFEENTIDKLNQILDKMKLDNILLLGDLNSTPYSFHFKKLIKLLNLKTFYHPLHNSNTWPSFLPNIMRIQIDNLLFRGNFKFSNIFVGNNHGSDHLPLFVDLEF